MSDIHHLPLCPHDMPGEPVVRAKVYSYQSMLNGAVSWYWKYQEEGRIYAHGPFTNWREAYDSARGMVELL